MKFRIVIFLTLLAVSISIATSLNSFKAETKIVDGSFDFASKENQTEKRPYIIGLSVGFQPEGNLASNEIVRQREAVNRAQDILLEIIEVYLPENVKRFESIPFIAFAIDDKGLEKLRSLRDVVSIEEDIPVPATLAESVPLVNAPAMFTAGFSGMGQTIAILDTGVDKTHSFLTGKVVSEACFSSTVSGSSTSVCPGGVQQSTLPDSGLNCEGMSGCDHGTHVAGIAAGNGPSFTGVAKDASLIAVQVFSRFETTASCGSSVPCTLSYVSDQILGLERVFALSGTMNISSVNMSLGSGQNYFNCDATQQARKAAIDNLRSVNIATVISSGNSSYTDSMGAPACISTAISVGSTGDGSNGTTTDFVSSFSNSSPLTSLFAPGAQITSSVLNNGFGIKQGTSMAAPHVAGAWAVLKQQNPAATVDQVFSNMAGSGTPVQDNRGSISLWKSRLNFSTLGCTYERTPVNQSFNNAGGTGVANIVTGGNCGWYTRANAFSTYQSAFSTNSPITVADNVGTTPGVGSLYPSIINITDITGTIIKVNVTLSGLNHTNPDDLDILLVHPNGFTQSILMSDAGGSGDVTNLNLTFDVDSISTISNEGQLFSGRVRPGNHQGSEGANDNFPAPGPGSNAYTASLTAFAGLSPVGEWKLYVVDDTTGEAGNISGGWNLEIFTKSTTGWLTVTSANSGTGNGAIDYTVGPNTFSGTRTGTLNVAGQVFTVIQTGGATPSPTPTPTPSPTPIPSPTPAPGACVFSNGGLNPQPVTESGVVAPIGFFWSELQHDAGNMTESNTLAGSGATHGTSRLVDDFTLVQPCTINSVTFYSYVTNGPTSPSPFTDYTLQIWNGRPGDVGSTVIFGDTTTNRLEASIDSTFYRLFNSAVPPPGSNPGTTRKIWRNTVSVNTTLQAGTYWVDWSSTIAGGGSHFHPTKTIAGSRGAAGDNARQLSVSSGNWTDIIDAGSPASAPDVPQDFPFDIVGTGSGATPTPTPTPFVNVSGRVVTPTGLGVRNAIVAITDSQGDRRSATTSSFGFYSFNNVMSGQTYIIGVGSKRYRFASRSLLININLSDVDFVGLE